MILFQSKSKSYSYPTDVYAVAVIWVELLVEFSTEHEIWSALLNLRNGIFPNIQEGERLTSFSEKYSKEVRFNLQQVCKVIK